MTKILGKDLIGLLSIVSHRGSSFPLETDIDLKQVYDL